MSRLIFSLGVLTILIGCGDESSKRIVEEVKEDSTPKIEIVENKDAKEIKVAVKEGDKNQSKSYYYDYGVKSNFDLKSQPANPEAEVKVRPRTVVEAFLHIRSPYEHVEVELLVKQLSKNFRTKCSACHSDYANGIIGPSLLGRDSDYIYGKIMDFKSGKKSNPLMNDLIKMMSDEEIRAMADEIYSFNRELEKMRENRK
jgi:cytochrome c553